MHHVVSGAEKPPRVAPLVVPIDASGKDELSKIADARLDELRIISIAPGMFDGKPTNGDIVAIVIEDANGTMQTEERAETEFVEVKEEDEVLSRLGEIGWLGKRVAFRGDIRRNRTENSSGRFSFVFLIHGRA